VKWEGYPDAENMWVDKDDVFADDKVREFKASNPDAATHIRRAVVAKSPHLPTSTLSHLLHQHALTYMSSDGNNDLAHEYTAGAVADSPIPFSQTNLVDTPVVTDLQGPASERMPEEKLRDFKTRAQRYARDRGSCDDTRISYLEFLESEAEADLTLARMIAG
jgi:hypothetical protein